MGRLIIITGTPGTGKSTLARSLARRLGWERLDLHSHYPSIASGYHFKKKAYDIDKRRFLAFVRQKKSLSKKGLVLDSHISHHLPAAMVDVCIVLTCSNLKVLQKRLQKRKYSNSKIRENLDAEIFQVCLSQAQERRHRIITFDTSTENQSKIFLKAFSKLRRLI